MPIKGYNLPALEFLLELDLQAQLVLNAFAEISKGVIGWRAAASEDAMESRASPLQLVAMATTLLSAVAAIAKILYEGKRPSPVPQRCAALRLLLRVQPGDFDNIQQLSVRNSFAHVDERLDRWMRHAIHLMESSTCATIESLKVSASPSPRGTIVLKRIDPERLSIEFSTERLDLTRVASEVTELRDRISSGLRDLESRRVDLYPNA